MQDFHRPLGVQEAQSKTRVERAAEYIASHASGNKISGCEFAIVWEAESRDAFDIRRGHYEESTGRQIAYIDNDGTFLCTLPPRILDGMTTDEIEQAVDESLDALIRRHLGDHATFDDIAIENTDVDGYATCHWMVDGVQVQFTVQVEAKLIK